MKIDLNTIDRSQFMVHQHFLKSGESVWLIQPQHIGVKWSQNNKHLRSVVVNSEGDVISIGFSKFTNWGENPENFPVPVSLKNAVTVEKLDGSLLIVSKYKGEYILRTRGTVDAETALDNGSELEVFKAEYLPKLAPHCDFFATEETWPCSILFEWLSPVNKIVINYGDAPEFRLVGWIWHNGPKEGQLEAQSILDSLAAQTGFKRPETYKFDSVTDLLSQVDAWKGKEGVVVYTHNGQMLHKVKGAWYLALHHMKSELSNIEKVMDVWLEQGRPDYQTFYTYIVNTFDYELAEQCRGHISNICDGYKEVIKIVEAMGRFVEPLKTVGRKDAALKIIAAYGETNRGGFCFKILDGKPLVKDDYKKLLFQVLKKG